VIQAACPLFLKDHSWGEYVFDHAWADAYNQQLARPGHAYYPKLLGAVPFSPIPGPRLMVRPGHDAATEAALTTRLLAELEAICADQNWSSAHLLFLPQDQADAARQRGWLIRQGVQFHWQNRSDRPYSDFDDFLADMQRDKRKKIRQERKKVADAGIQYRISEGADISAADWDFFYQCYAQTYLERGQTPYLSRDGWRAIAQALPPAWALVVAQDTRHGAPVPIASALLAIDRDNGVAYGRYWGAIQTVSCLHFETCYYQPLQWCIEQGFKRFEGGAQGEHKLARGLLPVSTYSAHHLPHPGFKDAVQRFLQREGVGMAHYLDELDERAPFRA
jgi:predicted N-acyltransferase